MIIIDKLTEFLEESNGIEDVFDDDSLRQARFAWEYIIQESKITPSVMRKAHKILMKNQPLEDKYKGQFRDCAVWIGGREGLYWKKIPEAIEKWCKVANGERTERQIKKDHVDYEELHPWLDGNGRSGRLWMNWTRIKNNLPILVIYEAEKQEYYKWFH